MWWWYWEKKNELLLWRLTSVFLDLFSRDGVFNEGGLLFDPTPLRLISTTTTSGAPGFVKIRVPSPFCWTVYYLHNDRSNILALTGTVWVYKTHATTSTPFYLKPLPIPLLYLPIPGGGEGSFPSLTWPPPNLVLMSSCFLPCPKSFGCLWLVH